jgi:small-conductance mechanosensitive channel
MPGSRVIAVAPLNDFGLWARTNLLEAILVVVGALLLARIASFVGNRVTTDIDERSQTSDALVRSESTKHRHAVAQVVTWAVIVLIYSVAALAALQRLGIPLSGFVAPATVAGVALGFGAQRVVQDILAGFFLITEKQYGFGDVVRLSVTGVPTVKIGTVEDVTLRITRVRTADGEVVITPNGQIVQVTNLSRDWARAVVDVPIPSTADVNRASDILRQVCADTFEDAAMHPLLLDPPSVMGVESIEVGQFNIRVVARTLPGKQFEIGRALRARIAIALSRAGITESATFEAAEPTSNE